MLANDVIHFELRRLIKLTAKLSGQVGDLTARLDALEAAGPPPAAADGLADRQKANA